MEPRRESHTCIINVDGKTYFKRAETKEAALYELVNEREIPLSRYWELLASGIDKVVRYCFEPDALEITRTNTQNNWVEKEKKRNHGQLLLNMYEILT